MMKFLNQTGSVFRWLLFFLLVFLIFMIYRNSGSIQSIASSQSLNINALHSIDSSLHSLAVPLPSEISVQSLQPLLPHIREDFTRILEVSLPSGDIEIKRNRPKP